MLKDSLITFSGNNSIIFLSENKFPYKLQVDIFTDCSLYFGKNNYMPSIIRFIVQEHANILIGNNNTFSINIKFRTSDAHPIYDIEKRKRINPSGNIIIGDHVWLAAGVNIFKNVEIGSGAVIDSDSVVSNEIIDSNTLNAGIPVRKLKNNICYDSRYVGNDSADSYDANCKIEDFIFKYVEKELLMLYEFKDKNFSLLDTYERLIFFEKILKNNSKNRFFRNKKLFESNCELK